MDDNEAFDYQESQKFWKFYKSLNEEKKKIVMEEEARKGIWRRPKNNAANGADTPFLPGIIVNIWQEAVTGEMHQAENLLRLPIRGGTVEITPHQIKIDMHGKNAVPPEAMHAAMMHITKEWGGEAVLPLMPNFDRKDRLLKYAYAEAYGIKLHDENPPLSFSEKMQLPGLVRKIEAMHQHQIPAPERPDAKAFRDQIRKNQFPGGGNGETYDHLD